MPAGLQAQGLLMRLAVGAAPAQFHFHLSLELAQAEMQVRAASARMAVPAIHLGHELFPVGQFQGGLRTDGGKARGILARMAEPVLDGFRRTLDAQMQPQERPSIRAVVAVERRWLPLAGSGEVHVAVPIDIGGGDATGHSRIVNAQFLGDVVEAALPGAGKALGSWPLTSSPGLKRGQWRGSSIIWSLPVPKDCNSGQRSVLPFRKPVACKPSSPPSLSMSSSLVSQPQPLRDKPSFSLACS